jgi:methylated-DNA-[protein]-cysteine S-methyltransferase
VPDCYTVVDSPVGELLLRGRDDGALIALSMSPWRSSNDIAACTRDDGALLAAVTQLGEYFAGTRTAFDLRLAPVGTPFHQQVWQALQAIPYGATTTYGALAKQLGRPAAARAVGLANGRNPIGIVIPCHRVIGADGTLTGYGGGLPRKRWLLDHEQNASAQAPSVVSSAIASPSRQVARSMASSGRSTGRWSTRPNAGTASAAASAGPTMRPSARSGSSGSPTISGMPSSPAKICS